MRLTILFQPSAIKNLQHATCSKQTRSKQQAHRILTLPRFGLTPRLCSDDVLWSIQYSLKTAREWLSGLFHQSCKSTGFIQTQDINNKHTVQVKMPITTFYTLVWCLVLTIIDPPRPPSPALSHTTTLPTSCPRWQWPHPGPRSCSSSGELLQDTPVASDQH